jgi:hypothetical protein
MIVACIMVVSTALYLDYGDEQSSSGHQNRTASEEELASLVLTLKRFVNEKRARLCVEDDYWGPHTTFRDRQFERVFRITQTYSTRPSLKASSKRTPKRRSRVAAKQQLMLGNGTYERKVRGSALPTS